MSSGTHASNPFKFINKASTQGVTWLFTEVCCVDSETKESPKALCLFRNIDVIRDMQWFSTNCGVFVLLWWWSLIAHGCYSRVFLSVDYSFKPYYHKKTNKRRHTYNVITAKTLFWFSSYFNSTELNFYLYIVQNYNNSCLKGFKCNWLLHSPDSDDSSSSILALTLSLWFCPKPDDVSEYDDGCWVSWTVACFLFWKEETEHLENGWVVRSAQV